MNVAGDSEEGYVLEVTLKYPKNLHGRHSDYPLASQKMKVPDRML